jgi:hypothetical protein
VGEIGSKLAFMTTSGTASEPAAFQDDLARTVRLLRGALTDLLASVSADPAVPQEMSRQLGIDKTLAWKTARLVTSEDPVASLEHLPGPAGLKILLAAVSAAGAPAIAVERVRRAKLAFDRMVELHSGDRATLSVMLAGLPSESNSPRRVEAARKQSFLGNSATWGIQARLRLGLHVIAPNGDDGSLLDVLTIGAIHDLRRLRTNTRWPLVVHQSYGANVTPLSSSDDALERGGSDGAPLIREFCSKPLPTLRAVDVPNGTAWELCPGPVGRTASMTATFGFLRRGMAPIVASEPDEVGEHLTELNIPVESVLIDLLVHKDLPFPMPPQVRLVSRMQTDVVLSADEDNRYILPVPEQVTPIGSVVSTPLLPRQPELVEMAVSRMGRQLGEFQGYRLVMRYPPIPTVAILSHGLPSSG